MPSSILDQNFEKMESDLQAFIDHQRKSIEKEKAELEIKKSPRQKSPMLTNPSARNTSILSQNVQTQNITPRSRRREEKKEEDSHGLSLNLGGYEHKHKKYENERREEYKKYLADQQLRTYGKSSTNTMNDAERQPVAKNPSREEFKSQIDQEYDSLLKQKKNLEKSYRVQFTEPNNDSRANKKVIEFDSDDEALFEFVKQAQQKKRRNSAVAQPKRSDEIKEFKNSAVFDGRANSVPPKIPAIFGGPSESEVFKVKNQQYKKELEEQIKEKELLKAKDKLKRLGRVTSDFEITNIEIPQDVWALPTTKMNNKENKKVERAAQVSQHALPPETHNNINNQAMNPYNMFMNQQQNAYGANPMMNPMMMPVAWNNYGMMPNPGYLPPQGQGNFVPQMMNYPNGNMNTSMNMPSAQNQRRKMWEEPDGTYKPSSMTICGIPVLFKRRYRLISARPLSVEQKNEYKPQTKTAVEKEFPKRPNVQPPGGVSQGLFGQSPSREDVNSKRAQQMAYQQELHKQMEEKKRKEKEMKAEQERYERKLEVEIATYDPWGKGGGGAPVRNQEGQVMADLRKFRQNPEDEGRQKDDFSSSPKQQQQQQNNEPSPLMKALQESQQQNNNGGYTSITKNQQEFSSPNNTSNHKSPGQKESPASTYARGAALKELQGVNKSPRDKQEIDEYKHFLEQQVEEKKRKQEELKEKARLEEEKENERILEQQRKIKEEFERDKERQRKKEEEMRKQNEELILAAEQKRFEETQKKKAIQEDYQNDLRQQAEKKLKAVRRDSASGNEEDLTIDLQPRTSSPPVPAVAKKDKKRTKHSSRQPKSHRNAYVEHGSDDQEPTSSNHHQQHHQRPPTNNEMEYLETIRSNIGNEQKTAADKEQFEQQKVLIKQLSALRTQLQKQERKVQNELTTNKERYDELLTTNPSDKKNHSRPTSRDVFEKAKRKSSAKKQSTTTDRESLAGRKQSSSFFGFKLEKVLSKDVKGKKNNSSPSSNDYTSDRQDFDMQQQEYMKQQETRLRALRENMNKGLHPEPVQSRGSKQSLLDSDSKFLSLTSNHEIVPQQHEQHKEKSARQRRRLKENEQNDVFEDFFTQLKEPDGEEDPDSVSLTSYRLQEIAKRNEERLRRFEQSTVNDGDPDDIVRDFLSKSK